MSMDAQSSQDFWCEAIRQRREVRFLYPSSSSRQPVERIVQPLAYGQRINGRRQMTVRGYQIGGESGSSGGEDVPRTFDVGRMTSLEYSDRTFAIPETYTPDDAELDVNCELSDTL